MEQKWSEYQEAAKQKFIEARGAWKWSAMWDTILELDPGIVASYASYSSVPDKRNYLDIRMRKFICIEACPTAGNRCKGNPGGIGDYLYGRRQYPPDERADSCG